MGKIVQITMDTALISAVVREWLKPFECSTTEWLVIPLPTWLKSSRRVYNACQRVNSAYRIKCVYIWRAFSVFKRMSSTKFYHSLQEWSFLMKCLAIPSVNIYNGNAENAKADTSFDLLDCSRLITQSNEHLNAHKRTQVDLAVIAIHRISMCEALV